MKRTLAEDLTGESESRKKKLICLRQESSKCPSRFDRFALDQIPKASLHHRGGPIPPHIQRAREGIFAYDQSPSAANRHSTTHNVRRPKPNECLVCGAEYRNRAPLERHIKEQHCSDVRFACPDPACSKIYNRDYKLRRHRRERHPALNSESFVTTENAVPAKCPICNLYSKGWDTFYKCLVSHHTFETSEVEKPSSKKQHSELWPNSEDSSLFTTAPGLKNTYSNPFYATNRLTKSL